MSDTKLSDPEKAEMLIEALGLTVHSFGQSLEYATSSAVYHIVNGKNSISKSFISRVMGKFPHVNKLFLEDGELPILLEESQVIGQKNALYPSFNDIPQLLRNIENVLIEIRDGIVEKKDVKEE